ncbi:MAG: glycosyltransferase [Leptolyngbyaceae cyanobacterium CRU_2_3]|nr:glycosyltransferase [Leptolyngbyaceae cyanobacterium CRU_2_3]
MNDLIPIVSVVMSVYNNARYLPAALDSILNQTFKDFRFLLVDDGSTDDSRSIVQTYAAKDTRIQLIERSNPQENWGLARSLNQLLSQATGEFIARMDADDISLPDRFARQVEFLRQHSEVVCVGSSLNWIDEKGRFVGHCTMPEHNEEIQTLLLGGVSMLHHPCTMFRRIPVIQLGGYNESMIASSDLDLWLRLGEVGKLANLPETLLLYRLHSQSITNAKQARQSYDAHEACKRAWQRRGIQGRVRP